MTTTEATDPEVTMLFRSYRKRKALESYRYVLGPRLRGTFGRREHYTPDEVIVTVAAHQLSSTFVCYALAMYCDRVSFDAYHHERGEECSYVRMWHELSAVHVSDGSMNLSAMRYATEREEASMDTAEALSDWSSASDAVGWDGGGFDGGGGGD